MRARHLTLALVAVLLGGCTSADPGTPAAPTSTAPVSGVGTNTQRCTPRPAGMTNAAADSPTSDRLLEKV